MRKIKNIILKIKERRQAMENFLCQYIPFFSFFLHIRNSFLDEWDKERYIFITKMPAWYSFIELSWFMRILRVFMGFWLIFYMNKHLQAIFTIIFDIPVEKIIDNIIAVSFTFFVIIFFSFFSIIKFYLGIRYFSIITRNSPITLLKCVQWGMRRVCNAGFLAGILGFGGTIIDTTAKKRGFVEPFDGYLQNATYKVVKCVTPEMAAESSKNLRLLNGDEFPGARLVRDYGQLNTLHVQKEHAQIYQAQQAAAPIKNESAALIKNQQYKKENN